MAPFTSSRRWSVAAIVLCVVAIFCTGDRGDPEVTYLKMYQEGREAYTKERWFEAIDFLEKAIEDWHWYRDELAQCRIKCNKFSDDFSLDKNMTELDLVLAGRWILNAACQKKCKREKFVGRDTAYEELIDDDFEKLKPYHYLQLSYYKASQFVTNYQELIKTKAHQIDYLAKAVQCAYTYLLRHPDDKMMRSNLDFFKSIPAVTDEMFVSREEPQHQKYYKAASAAYDNKPPDFQATKDNILLAIQEYYKAFSVCEAHCEKPLSNVTKAGSFSDGFTEDLFINIADHLGSYVDCVSKCPESLSMFFGRSLENYLPNHYHYLQFAAYKVDDDENAAMGCATYLLFHPEDEDMLNNRKFFQTKLGTRDEKFTPDIHAVQFLKHLKEIKKVKTFLDTHYRRKRKEPKIKTPKKMIDKGKDEAKPAITPDQLVPISKEKLEELKKVFEFVPHMDAQQLNGSHRVALDNVATAEECARMVELASAGSGGDGYNRFKGTGSHPHTPHESFAGLTVGRAAELAEQGTIKWQDAWTFLDMAERSRAITEKYFQLPSKLFFSFTHLVCRTAETTEAQKNREDLSHPIHSDNCNLLEDGTCIYAYPAFTWRDFSSILYLNEDFVGGDFLFANPNKTIQSTLRPSPGRLVAFHNGIDNLHGVKAVTSGRRCALAMWYTMDPMEHEKGQESHETARKILTNLKIQAGEEVDPADLPITDSTAETATPLESPPESPPPPPTPKDVDEILSSRDAEIEDFDNGGYQPVVMQGPEKHNEL